MEFDNKEKIGLFDKLAENYFNHNFGSMSKMDFETLLFSEYIEHCIKNNKPYDDYSLSKQLGITQSRIRAFKERKELKYPHEGFNWREAFIESIENARYDKNDHYVKMLVQDVNVMNEVRNFIESRGWYDECSLNKKLLKIPLDCFVELFYDEESFKDTFSEEIKNKLKKVADAEKAKLADFVRDFTKDGLKAFLMSASKEVVSEVLKILPFGGIASRAFEFLAGAVERS